MRQLVWRLAMVSRLALVGALGLGGCSSGGGDGGGTPASPTDTTAGGATGEEVSCAKDARVDAFTEGLAKTGANGFTVTLDRADPGVPARGDNDWSVTVLGADGEPQPGLKLTVTARMPDHGHMSPAAPRASATDEQGRSTVAGLDFFMPGVWLVELSIAGADAEPPLDSVSFALCIEG